MWRYFSVGLLLAMACGGFVHATTLVIDDFTTTPVDVLGGLDLGPEMSILQHDVLNVPGNLREVSLFSIGPPIGDTYAVVSLGGGVLDVSSPFFIEGFQLGYGSAATPSGDMDLSLEVNDVLQISFNYFEKASLEPRTYAVGFSGSNGRSGTIWGELGPSESAFDLSIPLSRLDPGILADIDGIVFRFGSLAPFSFSINEIRIVPEPSSWLTILISMSAYSVFLHRYVAKQRP